jgi:hypothetical protein
MSPFLYTLLVVAAALISLIGLCLLAINDRNAAIGKRLLEAAGSRDLAELAIAQTRDLRLLNDALRMRDEMRLRRSNVVRFVPKRRPITGEYSPKGAA